MITLIFFNKILKVHITDSARLAKEKVSYEKEAEKQMTKINAMKDEGKDEHDIRKQVC